MELPRIFFLVEKNQTRPYYGANAKRKKQTRKNLGKTEN